MFLHEFNQAQKVAYLGVVKDFFHHHTAMTNADREAVELMKLELDVHGPVPHQDGQLTQRLAVFTTRKERASVMLEILGLGYGHGDFDPGSDPFIKEVAAAFELSELDIVAMDSWVLREIALVQEAEHFWTDPVESEAS